jgi:predicted nucleic acid-binding protein
VTDVVADASAVAGWLLPHEDGAAFDALVEQGTTFHAPRLIWAEVRNILIVQERRGRLIQGQSDRALALYDRLGMELDDMAASEAVMGLARRHGLTIYDALYLELAIRRGWPLVTRDRRLIAAAQTDGVTGF